MTGRSPRLTQDQRREETRAKLISAAGRVFAERGFHNATLDQVIEVAGVSKGALYHHFPSKSDLFLALLQRRLDDVFDEADQALDEHGASKGAAGAIDAFVRRVERDSRWIPLLLEFLAYGSRDAHARRALVQRFFEPTRERLADTIRAHLGPSVEDLPVSVEVLATSVAAMANGLAIERQFDPEGPSAHSVAEIVEVLVAGLARPKEPHRRGEPSSH